MTIVIRTDANNYGGCIPSVRTFTVFAGTYAQCVAYIKEAAYKMRQKCRNDGSIISACSPRGDNKSMREVVHYGHRRNKITTRWDTATSHFVCVEDMVDVNNYIYCVDKTHRKLEIFSNEDKAEKFLRKNKNFDIVEVDSSLLDYHIENDGDDLPIVFKYNFKRKTLEILPGDSSAFEDGIFPSVKFHK